MASSVARETHSVRLGSGSRSPPDSSRVSEARDERRESQTDPSSSASAGAERESQFHRLYYGPKGHWRGETAVNRLVKATGCTAKEARDWLSVQPLWQIYLPPPKHIRRARFTGHVPNDAHQLDLYLPEDAGKKYALTLIDIGTRYKEAEPVRDKTTAAVLAALTKIYKPSRSPLRWPGILHVDSGKEFMGAFARAAEQNGSRIRRVVGDGKGGYNHRAQAIVERFNRTLAERIFAAQYATELDEAARGRRVRSTAWVGSLKEIIADLNADLGHTKKAFHTPSAAEARVSAAKAVATDKKTAPEKVLPASVTVRYLYEAGEAEEGEKRRRATDPIWSTDTYHIARSVSAALRPTLYYLAPATKGGNAPTRAFVREELLVVTAA